jgi:hypothetical protein
VIAHALNSPETDSTAEILRILSARHHAPSAADHHGGEVAPYGEREAEEMAAGVGSAEHVIAGWPGRT